MAQESHALGRAQGNGDVKVASYLIQKGDWGTFCGKMAGRSGCVTQVG